MKVIPNKIWESTTQCKARLTVSATRTKAVISTYLVFFLQTKYRAEAMTLTKGVKINVATPKVMRKMPVFFVDSPANNWYKKVKKSRPWIKSDLSSRRIAKLLREL